MNIHTAKIYYDDVSTSSIGTYEIWWKLKIFFFTPSRCYQQWKSVLCRFSSRPPPRPSRKRTHRSKPFVNHTRCQDFRILIYFSCKITKFKTSVLSSTRAIAGPIWTVKYRNIFGRNSIRYIKKRNEVRGKKNHRLNEHVQRWKEKPPR